MRGLFLASKTMLKWRVKKIFTILCYFFLFILTYSLIKDQRYVFGSLQSEIHGGFYMSAHVLLNLLNDLGKSDKMRGLPSKVCTEKMT